MCWTQSFKILSVGTFKTPQCIQLHLKSEETLYQRIFMPVKLETIQGPMKMCDSLWSDESMHALIQDEDTWIICCEMWLDKQREHESCWTVNAYCKFIVSVVSKMLHRQGIDCWT
jgi:hypothetical protein